MTKEQLKKLLFRKSIEAIYHLSDGDKDPQTIEESIYRNSRYRSILYCLQIFSLITYGNAHRGIVFGFSPDYLSENNDLTLSFDLDKLEWMFKFPHFDSGVSDSFLEGQLENAEIKYGVSVADWLAQGSVEIIKDSNAIYNLGIEQLTQSIVRTESD